MAKSIGTPLFFSQRISVYVVIHQKQNVCSVECGIKNDGYYLLVPVSIYFLANWDSACAVKRYK